MIVSPSCAYNLKTAGACLGSAPGPSPFVSVTNWVLPSTPLNRYIFLKIQLHQDTTVGCEVAAPLKRCIVQVGLGHRHIHNQINNMKQLNHCLWLWLMARSFPLKTTKVFPREKSCEF